jgi:uncharacterized protein (TIGR01777 family)
MKEVILITGANGMVAKHLSNHLENYELKFLTRRKRKKNEYEWNVKTGYIDKNALQNVNHIIHLAGAGIADKKWNKTRKKSIYSSRVKSAELILNTLIENKIKITSFISASAIGYYGTETLKNIFVESSKKGSDFLSDVCYDWEHIAFNFKKKNISNRTVILRFGIILDKNDGALKKMKTPMKYYLGAILGKGDQYMPWIHIKDLVSMIKFVLINSELKGIYNAVSPEHITNKEFTLTLAKHMKRLILLPNIPSFIIKLMFGDSSILLLKGSRVSSEKIIKKGFKFKYNNLKYALQNL